MMDETELKQHIVETYGLLPGQVVVFEAGSWILLWDKNKCNHVCSIETYGDEPKLFIKQRGYLVLPRIDEVIKLLQVAKAIIESGGLDG